MCTCYIGFRARGLQGERAARAIGKTFSSSISLAESLRHEKGVVDIRFRRDANSSLIIIPQPSPSLLLPSRRGERAVETTVVQLSRAPRGTSTLSIMLGAAGHDEALFDCTVFRALDAHGFVGSSAFDVRRALSFRGRSFSARGLSLALRSRWVACERKSVHIFKLLIGVRLGTCAAALRFLQG